MALCSDPVFVVTKGGRRACVENFLDYERAKSVANSIINSVQNFDKPHSTNSVKIVKTKFPYKIR